MNLRGRTPAEMALLNVTTKGAPRQVVMRNVRGEVERLKIASQIEIALLHCDAMKVEATNRAIQEAQQKRIV